MIINAMIKPTIETQISSTRCAEGAEKHKLITLSSYWMIFVDFLRASNLMLTFSWIRCIPLLLPFQSQYQVRLNSDLLAKLTLVPVRYAERRVVQFGVDVSAATAEGIVAPTIYLAMKGNAIFYHQTSSCGSKDTLKRSEVSGLTG